MAAGCKAAIGCVDARAPVRASYVSLYKWPESDAEFVKSVAMARRQGGGGGGQESPGASASYYSYSGSASMRRGGGYSGELAAGYASPLVVDSYSCRQMYLRSYTFSKKKETVPERTMACLGRVRERAAVFPFLPQREQGQRGRGAPRQEAEEEPEPEEEEAEEAARHGEKAAGGVVRRGARHLPPPPRLHHQRGRRRRRRAAGPLKYGLAKHVARRVVPYCAAGLLHARCHNLCRFSCAWLLVNQANCIPL